MVKRKTGKPLTAKETCDLFGSEIPRNKPVILNPFLSMLGMDIKNYLPKIKNNPYLGINVEDIVIGESTHIENGFYGKFYEITNNEDYEVGFGIYKEDDQNLFVYKPFKNLEDALEYARDIE